MPSRFRRLLFGAPIATEREQHERLPKILALPIFSSDGLSSVAYATQEIILALLVAGAGMATYHYTLPISYAIIFLLAVVTISYQQTIHAYPGGGGAYIVARDNLGVIAALTAGAALLLDYILTVAVSVAAGIDAVISAAAHDPHLFEALNHYRVALCIFAVVVVMVANLRGVRESGVLFALPTYSFIALCGGLVLWGLVRQFNGTLPPPQPLVTGQTLGIFLLLKAFASGCAALTGVEAISNGVTAFKPPEARNASITMIWMSCILGTMFLGTTYLATHLQLHYNTGDETVISQLGRAIYGTGAVYFALQIATCGILILAANTSFAGFPRLCAMLAADGFLPRQLRNVGDRLVFSNGIVVLAAVACVIMAIFGGHTDYLIPLYAVGVFLSFTLSQFGMVKRYFRLRPSGWQWKWIISGVGGVITTIVTTVICISKWAAGEKLHLGPAITVPSGAWMVVVLIPVMVYLFFLTYNHYRTIATQLTLEGYSKPEPRVNTVLVLIPSVHRGVIPAIQFARSINENVRAVHVETNPANTPALLKKWAQWGEGIPLVILESPYRGLAEPLLDYIDTVELEREDDQIVLVLPEFVPGKWWEQVLHNQTGFMLKLALLSKKNVVVCNVRYFLEPFSGPVKFEAEEYHGEHDQVHAPATKLSDEAVFHGTMPPYQVTRHRHKDDS